MLPVFLMQTFKRGKSAIKSLKQCFTASSDAAPEECETTTVASDTHDNPPLSKSSQE